MNITQIGLITAIFATAAAGAYSEWVRASTPAPEPVFIVAARQKQDACNAIAGDVFYSPLPVSLNGGFLNNALIVGKTICGRPAYVL